jgi:hypothetical protein
MSSHVHIHSLPPEGASASLKLLVTNPMRLYWPEEVK